MAPLAVLIPWCARPELRCALEANADVLSHWATEVILVNDGSDISELLALIDSSRVPNLCVLNSQANAFNKCRALNIASSHSKATNLLLLDADIIITDALMEQLWGRFDHGKFVTVEKGIELDPGRHPQTLFTCPCLAERIETTELKFTNGSRATIHFWQGSCGRSLSGTMLLRKVDYLSVEGLNSALSGWGFEDYDLQIRLQVQLGIERVSTGSATHITHAVDEAGIRAASQSANLQAALANYNRGNFLGTLSHDVAQWKNRTVRVR